MNEAEKDKKPSMFTTKGMLQLPIAIIIRIPLAIVKIVCIGVKLSGKAAARGEKWCDKKLSGMFKPEVNPQYAEYLADQAQKIVFNRRFK